MTITVHALSITEPKSFKLSILEFNEPKFEDHEFLIKNVAVAQNPVDWKQIEYNFNIPSLPWTNGGDVAGTVVKVGKDVTKFQVGDRVISFLSRKTARHGAYQTYSIAQENRTVKLPDSYSFEAGSTIPLAYVTAGAGLIHALKVSFPPLKELPAKPKNEPLLVWGGSSSVGAYVVQLAKAAGYTVISTASPANHDYVKSLGAEHVFDYHDADVVEKIRKAAGPNLSLVYDAISEGNSPELSVKSVTAASGGSVAAILPVPAGVSTEKVKIVQTGAIKAQEDPENGKAVYGVLEELLSRGTFIPNRVKIIPGGLNGVAHGFELGRQHKVSGEKFVYVIADTAL